MLKASERWKGIMTGRPQAPTIEQTSDQPSGLQIKYLQRKLLKWFARSDRGFPWRSPNATKYQRVIAEVLLQRTQANVVAQMFRSFIRKYPSWQALAAASESELIEILKPLGLWSRRAASIKALASAMASRRGRFPRDRESLEDLPGVGQYISNAILIFDQGLCFPLLDVNLARVLERVFGPRQLADIRYDPYLQDLATRVVQHADPARINWAFLDLAALVCTIRAPHCKSCPLNKYCRFAQNAQRGL